MNRSHQFKIRRIGWNEAGDLLKAVRKTVFVVEQSVPEQLEWDNLDEQCIHVLAETAGGEAIGTGRLLPDGRIGRMAVLKHWRGKGVGSAILMELIAAAREGEFESAVLNAQTHALEFYARFGFEVISEEFMEAGIPHRAMRLALVKPKQG